MTAFLHVQGNDVLLCIRLQFFPASLVLLSFQISADDDSKIRQQQLGDLVKTLTQIEGTSLDSNKGNIEQDSSMLQHVWVKGNCFSTAIKTILSSSETCVT